MVFVRRTGTVPVVDKNWGIALFIVNIFLPGVGTFIAGLKGEKNTTLVVGVLQFLLAFLLIGWIWSIVWGYFIYKKSTEGYTGLGI